MIFKTNEMSKLFFSDNKKIIIANHTTPFFDGFWLHCIFYYLDHFFYVSNMFGFNNKNCRSICSPNFIEKETNYLKSKDNFLAIIFPSGGQIKWKSGFYWLAKNLDCPIYLVNINYNDQKIEFLDRIKIQNDTYEDIKKKCQNIFKEYVKKPFWYDFLSYFGYGDEVMN